MSVVAEFSKRNVFRVGAAYLVGSWLIVQVAQTIFPLFGFSDMPARIVVIVLAIGFVPSLILAWAFRWTPSGLRKESEIDAAQPTESARRLDRIIIMALALAVSLFAIDRFVLEQFRDAAREEQIASRVAEARQQGRAEALTGSYGDRSIVVLPFANMSDDAGNEFFADGISEEILNLLTRVPELRVISRSSAFSYKGLNTRLSQISAELHVAHVLEGSVRKSGDRVRITAQLIDARSDTHLWSETFDRRLDDVFAVQEEIAAAVAEQLKISLLGDVPRLRATDPDAYALYLQARSVSQQNTAESAVRSIALLERVLAIDPNYTNAWDALSAVYLNQAARGLLPLDEGFRKGREAAESALTIDPNFAPAYARLARIALLRDNNLPLAARHYKRALELAPKNVRIIGEMTLLLRTIGRTAECVPLDEYVVAHDPVNPSGHYNLGSTYLFARRYADSIASLNTALELSPNRIGAYYHLGIAQLLQGDVESALQSTQNERLDVLRIVGSAIAHDAAGDSDSYLTLLNEAIEMYESDAAYNIATVLAYHGDADAAFEWLGKAVTYGDPGLAEIVADPLLDNLRTDSRWIPLLQSMGKGPAQLDAIVIDVSIPRA